MSYNMQDMYFDTILLGVKSSQPKNIYKEISSHVSGLIGTPEDFLLNMIMKNQEEQNSGVQNGVSIIHAQLPRLTRPIILFAKLEKEADFHAADGKFVDMVALILSPEFEGVKHLQRLSAVTRFFNDEETRNTLRKADSADLIRNAVRDINTLRKVA